MSSDKVNGKLTNIELEMAVDETKRMVPYQIKILEESSKILKARYESLIKEGFSEKQALEIVKFRGIES
ncbi:hypothetical protein ACUXCC_001998 [Cytobacillus horneckiae]|uniref:hypothetical protein n=1 Tax=Cytobacillus horneckiae TaxID=549687 RepID=UPI0019CFC751|nr:hypothetical protein [Cytobacillus horneckiae]MBN6886991.1 hypothetical protein [Cytobacillus horneckiae]